LPAPSSHSIAQAKVQPPQQKSLPPRLWHILIDLWIAAIIVNFLNVRILGSLTVQRILHAVGRHHLP
jgi:hypothetical protein